MNLFSIDVDWADDKVIEFSLNLFSKYGISCTVFATHASPVLKSIKNDTLFEIAIHPNFNDGLINGKGKDAKTIICDLLEIYPEARGVRSHGMTQSTPLLNVFKDCGIIYEANHFLPYSDSICPFKLWNGLIRVPYNWEDDIHFLYRKTFLDSEINLNNKFNLFDFHPIHVFLNTDIEKTYLDAKVFTRDYNNLKKFENKNKIGARDLLLKLFNDIEIGRTTTVIEFLNDNKLNNLI